MKYSKIYSILVVTLLLVFSSSLTSAEDRALEVQKLMWESKDPEFKVSDVPEKWKNESAVILAQKHYNEYVKEVLMNILYQKEYFHRRLKLQDKAAVSDYSELSYPDDYSSIYNSDRYFVGIKIIKPDGKTIKVDLKNAVVMEKKTNGYTSKYKKIAIPSLEPGDILDYYICSESSVTPYLKYYTFSTVIFDLQEKYPILKQSVEFKLKRRCFLNIKLSNNAPELKIKEDPADESTIYYLTSENVEKVNERLWHYAYRSLPTMKFQVYYAAPSTEGMFDFIGEQRIPKTSISQTEMLKYVNSNFVDFKSSNVTYVEAYLKKYYPLEKDPNKIIELAYNYLRAMTYNPLLTAPISGSERQFINTMHHIMKKRQIPHELIVAVPREISTIDQAVVGAELEVIMKVNNAGKPFYLIPPKLHNMAGDINPQLQGATGFAINPMLSKSERKLNNALIPVVPHLDNNTKNIVNVVLNDQDFSTVKAKVEVIEKGLSKQDDQSSYISPYTFLEDECKVIKVPSTVDKLKGTKKADEIKRIDRIKGEFNELLEASLKEKAESEYDAKILSVKNFQLKQCGRWKDSAEMIYTQEIEFEGLTKKVGPNYILEVGRLIGKQIELTEEDKKRKYDVYMPNARSFTNEIVIQIPDGYVVEGIESLNFKNENKTGGFTSKAVMDGNKLVVTSFKYYINNFEKAADWKLIEDFLEDSYKFTQQKVLLKKK